MLGPFENEMVHLKGLILKNKLVSSLEKVTQAQQVGHPNKNRIKECINASYIYIYIYELVFC